MRKIILALLTFLFAGAVAAPVIQNNGSSTWYLHGVTILCQFTASTPVTTTGSTSETNLKICTIPAGVMTASSVLRITAAWSRSASGTDSVSFFTRMSSTSGAATGGLNLGFGQSGSGIINELTMSWITNTTTSAQTAYPGNGFGSQSGTVQTSSINTASVSYINFNCQNSTSASDTCGIYSYTVELLNP